MNVVILYDDFACAAKAKVILERAAHRADAVLVWTVKPWRLDMLMPSLSADAALTDAADAHLVVLSLRHPLPLPTWVSDWLDQWATRRQVQEAALAVWDGGNGDTLSCSAAPPELSDFARHHGLNFIIGNASPEGYESAVSAPSLHGRGGGCGNCGAAAGSEASAAPRWRGCGRTGGTREQPSDRAQHGTKLPYQRASTGRGNVVTHRNEQPARRPCLRATTERSNMVKISTPTNAGIENTNGRAQSFFSERPRR